MDSNKIHVQAVQLLQLGVDNQTHAITKGRFQLLQNYWNKCQENAAIIEAVATDADAAQLPFFKSKLLDKAEVSYMQAYDFFQEKLEAFNVASISIPVPTAAATTSINEIRLPKINLPSFSGQYVDFLNEYEELGHMQKIENVQRFFQPTFLPHHPVIREDNTTTKLRVVFNASANTSNNTSLNDHLMIGPKLQADLPAIILQWRLYKYVFSADIQQMFRQIQIHSDDRQYQLILWRTIPNELVHTYSLNTVTYGTACAPYLAQRVLKQLSIDESSRFPLAQAILQNEIYVDDVLSGGDDKPSTIKKRDQLIGCLLSAGIHLRKWASNDFEILQDINPANHGLASSKPFQE
ncbi:uncharacterized protein LOC114930318, partial [Nylanderia fulva]|uniref:uncharacterized protein LOC114930318 n=1 Tax=Nylanderia fulva TaxID=613905 RepID=UPI0010FB9EBD